MNRIHDEMLESLPSREELIARRVLEGVDRVPGDRETTAFKQRARLHQALWREAQGLPEGTEPTRPRAGAPTRPIGSRLEINFAFETGANFLSDGARAAAQHRVGNPEPKQALSPDRLYADLLSSMPMCFNLFGPLWADRELAAKAIAGWWPDAPGRLSAIRFEWSPGRQLRGRYLENRTACDVAFEVATAEGARGVVGVETKYHEHCKAGASPSPERVKRYLEVVGTCGVFKQGAIDAILGTRLQQIFLDHLLVLSFLHDGTRPYQWAKFVLVHPSRNPSFANAARDYAAWLSDSSTFEVRTLESFLEGDALPPEAVSAFRTRYLW
jgi:hypothetical protein